MSDFHFVPAAPGIVGIVQPLGGKAESLESFETRVVIGWRIQSDGKTASPIVFGGAKKLAAIEWPDGRVSNEKDGVTFPTRREWFTHYGRD